MAWTWATSLKPQDVCNVCRTWLKTQNGNVVRFNEKLWCVPCILDAGTKALGSSPEPAVDFDFSKVWAGMPGP